MVRLALVSDPHFEVSEVELQRAGPSYTVETLSALKEHLGPACDLYFVLGEDALHDLPSWKEPRRIVELAWLAVAPRPTRPAPVESSARRPRPPGLVTKALAEAVPGITRRVIALDMPAVDISATALRERAQAGGSLRYLVPLSVEEYIRRHGLYSPAADVPRPRPSSAGRSGGGPPGGPPRRPPPARSG